MTGAGYRVRVARVGRIHRSEFASTKTRVGRCNLGVEGSELTKLLVAEFTPSGLDQGGLGPLPTKVPTEVVRNRDPGSHVSTCVADRSESKSNSASYPVEFF